MPIRADLRPGRADLRIFRRFDFGRLARFNVLDTRQYRTSSDFPLAFDAPLKALNPTLNPHVRYFDGSRRGYLRCLVTRSAWHTDVRTVDTIDVRESPVRTSASYAVEAGVAKLVPA
ncbi:MAG: alkaline phosphatase D family protein [Actinoplanes sp.]